MRISKPFSIALAVFGLGVAACDSSLAPTESAASLTADGDLVWAVNVGGPAYESLDGTRFEAESSIEGGTTGRLDAVKGSQDATLYQSYRVGDIRVSRPIGNGTYDLTFHFAEPEDLTGGERVFDALAEGKRVIDNLDVMLFRDGKVRSGLSVTAPDVTVADGVLDIEFEAQAGTPTLSALVVRNKTRAARSWKLVWSDEFDQDGEPDAGNWSINEWPARKVNDEDQAYTTRSRNLRVENGRLVIEAHKEDFEDASYTSGRVHASGKGDFLYGRFEVRAKLPAGRGTWPAIWMLPSNPFEYATSCAEGEDWQGSSTCDAWPNSGEIDIMEHVGYQMGHVHGTVHTKAYYWVEWEQRKGRILLPDVDTAFHVYAMEWAPEDIRIFVDDTLYFVYTNENTGWQTWPFDQPFHLILNVAVGGMWGRSGGGIDDDIFPVRMEVDYVRVYEDSL